MLTRKETYGLPGCDGSIWSNIICSGKEEHLLFAILYANVLHPFTRFERVVWLFDALAFQLFLISLFLRDDGSYEGWESIVVSLCVFPYKLLLRAIIECPCFEQAAAKAEQHDMTPRISTTVVSGDDDGSTLTARKEQIQDVEKEKPDNVWMKRMTSLVRFCGGVGALAATIMSVIFIGLAITTRSFKQQSDAEDYEADADEVTLALTLSLSP